MLRQPKTADRILVLNKWPLCRPSLDYRPPNSDKHSRNCRFSWHADRCLLCSSYVDRFQFQQL